MAPGAVLHPRLNDDGEPVVLLRPSQPSSFTAWSDPSSRACVTPNGLIPEGLNGVSFMPWRDTPVSVNEWEILASRGAIDEPTFVAPAGYKRAAGAVVVEADGRVWLVAPSNAYGGYKATFPKGGLDGKSPQATALVETFEESGLRVRLLRHLIDVRRSLSYTRYYLAERVEGSPADMGWESQAVMLVPVAQLSHVLNSHHDAAIMKLLMSHQ